MSAEQTIGIGIDVCNVSRIQQDIEELDTFVIDTFTDPEIVYCEQAINSFVRAQRYAARFAAKEAVIKALGGIEEGVNFQDIYILKGDRSGQPFIHLEGMVQARAEELGVTRFFISIAHEKDIAIAECRAIGEGKNDSS